MQLLLLVLTLISLLTKNSTVTSNCAYSTKFLDFDNLKSTSARYEIQNLHKFFTQD